MSWIEYAIGIPGKVSRNSGFFRLHYDAGKANRHSLWRRLLVWTAVYPRCVHIAFNSLVGCKSPYLLVQWLYTMHLKPWQPALENSYTGWGFSCLIQVMLWGFSSFSSIQTSEFRGITSLGSFRCCLSLPLSWDKAFFFSPKVGELWVRFRAFYLFFSTWSHIFAS